MRVRVRVRVRVGVRVGVRVRVRALTRLHVAVVPGEQLRLRDEAVAVRVELEEDRLHLGGGEIVHLGPARVRMAWRGA